MLSELRNIFKKQRFVLLWLFTFASFFFIYIYLYFCWFSVAPSPLPGPDWSHLWSMLVPFLFGFGKGWRTTEEKNDKNHAAKQKTKHPYQQPTIQQSPCYFKSQPWGRSSILFNTFQRRRCPRRKATHKSRLGPCHNKRRKLQYFSIFFNTF